MAYGSKQTRRNVACKDHLNEPTHTASLPAVIESEHEHRAPGPCQPIGGPSKWDTAHSDTARNGIARYATALHPLAPRAVIAFPLAALHISLPDTLPKLFITFQLEFWISPIRQQIAKQINRQHRSISGCRYCPKLLLPLLAAVQRH